MVSTRRPRTRGTSKSASHDGVATREVLNRVGDKWSVMVIVVLADGTKRFNDLKRAIDGVSQRMLTITLRGLERDGLIKRTVFATIPPRVEYILTALGRTLVAPAATLATWASRHRPEIQRARMAYDRASRKAAVAAAVAGGT